MRPFCVNGQMWRVVRVAPDDPRLVDREGKRTVGTADPLTRTVHLSSSLRPPMLDRVLLHEVAHAATMSYGLMDAMHDRLPQKWWVFVEEWAAQLVENHGIEAASAASQSLGRPVCIGGFCHNDKS